MTIAHARRIEKIFEALYPEYNGELAKVMTSEDPRVYGRGGLLDQSSPQIPLPVRHFGMRLEKIAVAK